MTLEDENKMLRRCLRDTLWMARRYANGRSTYAVQQYNQTIEWLIHNDLAGECFGNLDSIGGDFRTAYAMDGSFGWPENTDPRWHVKK